MVNQRDSAGSKKFGVRLYMPAVCCTCVAVLAVATHPLALSDTLIAGFASWVPFVDVIVFQSEMIVRTQKEVLAPALRVALIAGGAAQVPLSAVPGMLAAAVQVAGALGQTRIGSPLAHASGAAIVSVAVPAMVPVLVTVNEPVLVRLLG